MSICCPLGMAKTETQWEQFKLAAWGRRYFSAEHRLWEQSEWEYVVCVFHKMVAMSECSSYH